MASGTIRPEWVTPNNPTINLTNIESENTDIKVRSLNGLICFQGTLRIKQNVAVNGVLATDCPLPALASAWIFMMGATTPSYDLEKPIDATYPYEHITREMAEDVAKKFTGEIQQIPPMFSAVKHQGERSYEIARRGEEAQLTAKNITIYEFEITRFELPEIDFRIRCSKGTYIRAIARDFGQALNSGAHLTALRRTRIGSLCVEDSIKPEIHERSE